jgi:hypothetical protein
MSSKGVEFADIMFRQCVPHLRRLAFESRRDLLYRRPVRMSMSFSQKSREWLVTSVGSAAVCILFSSSYTVTQFDTI